MNDSLKQSLENLKHLPSTLVGLGASLGTIVQFPDVQKLASVDPVFAMILSKVSCIVAIAYLLFGIGKKATSANGEPTV